MRIFRTTFESHVNLISEFVYASKSLVFMLPKCIFRCSEGKVNKNFSKGTEINLLLSRWKENRFSDPTISVTSIFPITWHFFSFFTFFFLNPTFALVTYKGVERRGELLHSSPTYFSLETKESKLRVRTRLKVVG